MMLDWGVVSTFFLLWLVIIPTPGANSLMVTHLALERPAAHVAFAVLGNVAGVLLLGVAALLGWGALLEALPWLRAAVHVAGGAYLIYFGGRLLMRAAGPARTAAQQPGVAVMHTEPREAIALGFVTALSNAQAILFITSIFAVSGVLMANAATAAVVLAVIAVANSSYLLMLGWLFQRATVRAGYRRIQRWFDCAIGVVFVGFGLRLIWREIARN